MSLKAKIEAVIYAAEEPVTLAQLAGLFAAEVLESLAQREAEQPPAANSPDPALHAAADDEVVAAEAGTVPEAADSDVAATENEVSSEFRQASENTDSPEAAPEAEDAAPSGEAPSEEAPALTVEDAKKKATRQRERSVRDELKRLISELIEEYAVNDRGMEIREVAGGYRVATKPEYHDAVRSFVKSLKPPMKLSLQALETLAVIAYKQPVTAPEVSEIRGVDSGGVLGSLISRKLITTAGRKQVIGRPILYKTTKEFLLRFGLKDISELPSIEEFEKMAGEIEIAEDATSAEETAPEDALPFTETAETALETGEAQPQDEAATTPADSEAAGTPESPEAIAAESAPEEPANVAAADSNDPVDEKAPEALEVAAASRGSHPAEGE